MRPLVLPLFALASAVAACSNNASQSMDMDQHSGGAITLPQCGYTVTTVDQASIPVLGTNVLGTAPTPRFVHVTVPGDPRSQMAVLWRTSDADTLATTVQFGENGATDQTATGFTFVYDTADGPVRMHET